MDELHILPASELNAIVDAVAERLARREVGIVPTDTIYGLTGLATDQEVVDRIGRIKQRQQPATIIPPSFEWCRPLVSSELHDLLQKFLERDDGATILVPYSPRADAPTIPASLTSSGLIGLRRPRHWIGDLACQHTLPLVTTSVNRSGQPPMACRADLDPLIAEQVDFVVEAGQLTGGPSLVYMLSGGELTRLR